MVEREALGLAAIREEIEAEHPRLDG